MKAPRALWTCAASLAVGFAAVPFATAQPLNPQGGVPQFVPREIVVFPRNPAQSRALAQRMRAEGFLVLATAPISGMILAATPMEGVEPACIAWLRAWPEVRSAQNLRGESTARQPVPDCPYDLPIPDPCSNTVTGSPYPNLQVSSACQTPAPGEPNDPAFCLQWALMNTGQQIVDRSPSGWAGSPPVFQGECWEQTALPGIDVNVVPAWERTTGNAAVVVAILDSGIEYCNPDFDQSRFFFPDIAFTCVGNEGFDYPCCNFAIDPPCNFGPARDNRGHGTVVGSILGATVNNATGISGIDQECRILSARMQGPNGTGAFGIDYNAVNTARAVLTLETIASDPTYLDVRVINMSFKLEPHCAGACDQVTAFEQAVNLLVQQNRFVVVASSNDGIGKADFFAPAAFPQAITVGGVDSRGWRVHHVTASQGSSSSGTGYSLDFMAPGMGHVALICQSNPCPTCPYLTEPCRSTEFHKNFLTGTSYAAPMVCGAISLILAGAIELDILDDETWVGLSHDDVLHILRQGARDQVAHVPGHIGDPGDTPGWDTHFGWGLIDIDASLEYLETHYPCGNPPC